MKTSAAGLSERSFRDKRIVGRCADRIDIRIGNASTTLHAVESMHGAGSFDLVFIDADKTGYGAYYEASLRLVRPGGLLVLDNTLRRGRMASPDDNEADTIALRHVDATIANDERVDRVLLPIASGMTLARRRQVIETSGSPRVAKSNKISD